MQIAIFRPTDLVTPALIVPRADEDNYIDERNRDGGGSFRIRSDDPTYVQNLALFAEGNLVRMSLPGKQAWFEIEKPAPVAVAEDVEKWVRVAGSGPLAWTRHAVVFPRVGEPAADNSRRFNFASAVGPWFVPAEWGSPVTLGPAGAGKGDWTTGPGKWPLAGSASWIWDRAAAVTAAPAGDVYFRREFNLTGATRSVRLSASVRGTAAFYMDGVQVMAITEFSAYQRTYQVDVDLTPGAHTFAVKAQASGGPAGLVAMLAEIRDNNEDMVLADRIWWTGSGAWSINAYPAKAPGWTAGMVLKALLGEARARGVTSLLRLTDTFTELLDSRGVPWAERYDWEFRIGSSYREVISDMIQTIATVWVGDDFTLNVAQDFGTDRSTGDAPVVFRRGLNVRRAKSTPDGDDIVNSLLVMTADGLIESQAGGTSAARFGRREAYLSVTNASKNGVAPLLARQVFDQRAVRRLNPEISIVAVPGATPWVDFQVGDWVLAPSDNGDGLVKRRIESISVMVTGTADPQYSLEIDSIAMTTDERLARWLLRNDAGGLGGTVGGSSGFTTGLTPQPGVPTSPDPVIPGSKIQTPRAPSSLDGTSSAYLDRSGRPLAQVLLTWPEVTLDTDGAVVNVEGYEVWERRNLSDQQWISRGTVSGTSASMGGYVPGQEWQFRVRTIAARSLNPSAYSETETIAMAIDNTPPPAPSKPILSSRLGTISVLWDGRDAAGLSMPADLDYVTVNRVQVDAAQTRINYCLQPTPTRPGAPIVWSRYGGGTPNDPYRDATDSAGGAACFAIDLTATGITQGTSRFFATGAAGSYMMTVQMKAPAGRAVTVTLGTSTQNVTATGGWQSLLLTATTTSPNQNLQVTLRAVIPEGEAPFTLRWDRVTIEKGIVFTRTFFDGDSEGCVWDGEPEASTSSSPVYIETAVARLFPTVGSMQYVDADQAYNATVAYRLRAVDTSANVSDPSEVASISVKPLVDTDIIGQIITDANIVNVDGSKINPTSIETTSLKVGQANLLQDPQFGNPALREYRASYGNVRYDQGPDGAWVMVMQGVTYVTLASEPVPNHLAPPVWIEVTEGQEYVFTTVMDHDYMGTMFPLLRCRVLAANGNTVWVNGTSMAVVGSTPTEYSSRITMPVGSRLVGVQIYRTSATGGDLRIRSVGFRSAVGGVLIENGAITAAKIAALAITAGSIAANAVTADKILAGAVTAVKIDADAVTTTKLDALAITAKHTITAAKYQTTATALRGIEITSVGLRAYNTSGEETVYMSATTGAVTISGTFRTGVEANQVVISDAIFQGRPGIRFDTGSTAGLEPTIQSMGVASAGYPAGALIITGRESTVNSTGRADLVLSSGGDFALLQQYGTNNAVGLRKTGNQIELAGRLMTNGARSTFRQGKTAVSQNASGVYTVTYAVPAPFGTYDPFITPDGVGVVQHSTRNATASSFQISFSSAASNSTSFRYLAVMF